MMVTDYLDCQAKLVYLFACLKGPWLDILGYSCISVYVNKKIR